MASNFNLLCFVSEFCNYANMIRPWDSADGVFSMQVDFSVIRGRIFFGASFPDPLSIHGDVSPMLDDIHCLLTRAVCDLNAYNGFSDLGKNRTFVLSINPECGGLVYGVGGA